MLSNKAINEFQKIYKKEFGEDISFEGAQKYGIKLLLLFKIIYRQTNNKLNKYDQ